MSKSIRIDDETYEKLKAVADKSYRTLGSQIEYMLNLEDTVVAQARYIEANKALNDAPVPTNDRVVQFPDGSHGFTIPTKKNIDLAEPKDKWQEVGVKPLPACCSQEKLCKHWVWSMDSGVNINSITGEVRE